MRSAGGHAHFAAVQRSASEMVSTPRNLKTSVPLWNQVDSTSRSLGPGDARAEQKHFLESLIAFRLAAERDRRDFPAIAPRLSEQGDRDPSGRPAALTPGFPA